MSRIGLGRTATTTVEIVNDITTVSEVVVNTQIVANMTSDTTSVAVEQYFISATAAATSCVPYHTFTGTNVQDAIQQLESQFTKGTSDPAEGTDYLDLGDLFYNTSTNQLKVYRGSGVWDILLQAEGDMDTLDGNTF